MTAPRASADEIDKPRGRLENPCVSATGECDAWRPVFACTARGVDLPR